MSTRSKRKNNLVLLRSHSSGIRNRESGEGHVGQVDLEELLLRRREVMELEERIAVALSKGARVETGVHTAELVPERRHSAGRELFMKLIILAALCAALPTIIFSQDHVIAPASSAAAPAVPVVPQIFALPGGAAFHVKADEMTDQRGCRVETPLFVAYAIFDGRGAEIKTAESIGVEYNEKAILRIADREPFELYVPQRPNTILIPPSHTADFVGALYARERIRLRFTQWPGAQEKNLELEIGDFAAGYDLGVELCGWPKPSIARVSLPHEPRITQGSGGKLYAKFGGVEGWTVYINPRENWCTVKGPFGKSIASYMDGKVQSDEELGVVKYFTSHGQFDASTQHRQGVPAPTVAIMNAAARVGEDGMIEVGHHLYSFFGLRDALQFAAKTCNQPALMP